MASQGKMLVRVAEAAELLSISRSKANALIADGAIPALKVGSSLRVSVRQLQHWIDAQEGADDQVGVRLGGKED